MLPGSKLMSGADVLNESTSNELEINLPSGEIKEGEEIWIASSNDKAKILKIERNKIILDKKVCSANEDKILKGEIVIFPEHFTITN